MGRSVRIVLVCTLLAPFAVADAARAQDDTRHQVEAARDHMDHGQELFTASRFAEAATEFEAAYQAQPFSAFLYNAAVAYERAGQPGRAADFFSRYLDRDPQATDARGVRDRIERLRTEALAHSGATPPPVHDAGVGELDAGVQNTAPTDAAIAVPDAGAITPPPPDAGAVPQMLPQDFKSLLSVQTNPPGSTVTVRQGDRVVATGTSPYAVTLDQGEYRITVAHADYRDCQTVVHVHPGKVFVVIVEMSQGEFLGFLRVVTNIPGASVFLDDHAQGAIGRSPYQNPIATGQHHVWIERPGYRDVERDVEVGVGEDITLRADLERTESGRLRVVANARGGAILVDEHQVGVVPWEGEVSGGPHRVRVQGEGMKDWEGNVTVRQGQLTPIRVRLRAAQGRGDAWTAAVASAVFLGGGIGMGVLSSDMGGALAADRSAGRLVSNDPRLLTGTILAVAADVSFGLSTIFGLLAVYYFVRETGPPSDATVLDPRDWAVVPLLGPAGGGAALAGRF